VLVLERPTSFGFFPPVWRWMREPMGCPSFFIGLFFYKGNTPSCFFFPLWVPLFSRREEDPDGLGVLYPLLPPPPFFPFSVFLFQRYNSPCDISNPPAHIFFFLSFPFFLFIFGPHRRRNWARKALLARRAFSFPAIFFFCFSLLKTGNRRNTLPFFPFLIFPPSK